MKPTCKLSNQNGNIFNLLGIASLTLKEAGLNAEAKEMFEKVTSSKNYDEAIKVISDFVEVE